ncbi:MAG: glycoside hydrolase family 127 protein, partial [Thermoleophilia bacterium]|nr:glycoside hydrolase family 127 protein [Thermoleophilia bacterium]
MTRSANSRFLPGILGLGAAEGQMMIGGSVRWLQDHLGGKPQVTSDSTAPIDQAKASWVAMKHSMGYKGEDGSFSSFDANRTHIAAIWPLGQVLAGALDIAARTGDYHDVNATMSRLAEYESGDGYAPGTVARSHRNLYDDNDWVALDFLQAYNQTGNSSYLEAAKKNAAYLEQGLSSEGGMYWGENEQPMSRNTCSNAPTEQVMLRLYQATGDKHYLDVAHNVEKFRSSRLLMDNGLYGDNIADGSKTIDPTVFSYNQGTPIGADVLWYQTTGDKKYLERAQ